MGINLDEFLIFKPFFYDHMDHGQGQGVVRAGAQLEPDIGFLGQKGFPWIDHDGLGVVTEPIAGIEAGLPVGAGIKWLVAPKTDAFGLGAVQIIAHRQIAHGQGAGIDPWMETLGEAGLAPIGAAEGKGEA